MKNLIATLALIILSALLSLYDKWKDSDVKGYKKNNGRALGFFLIALIGAAFSLSTGLDAKEKSEENEKLSDSLRISQTTIIHLQERQQDSTNKILNYTFNLINKSDSQKSVIDSFKNLSLNLFGNLGNANNEIKKLQKHNYEKQDEFIKELTGFNSIPLLTCDIAFEGMLAPIQRKYTNNDSYTCTFLMQKFGQYPISNLKVFFNISRYRATFMNEVEDIGTLIDNNLAPLKNSFNIDRIQLNSSMHPYIIKIIVQWKVIYICTIKISSAVTNLDYDIKYSFNNKEYSSSEILRKEVQEYLESVYK